MTALPADSKRKYDLGFARWVYENVDGGDKMSLCMQCGMCSGSCPIGTLMDHGPRKLFMMVRAGMKEAVLTSNTIWNCTSCYNCVVRCRQIGDQHPERTRHRRGQGRLCAATADGEVLQGVLVFD